MVVMGVLVGGVHSGVWWGVLGHWWLFWPGDGVRLAEKRVSGGPQRDGEGLGRVRR